MPSSAALDGPRQLTEYRPTGVVPARLTPQREQALAAIEGRQGTIRELADLPASATALCAGWPMPARSKRSRSTPTGPLALPIPISRRPTSMTTSGRPPRASPRPSPRASIPSCSTASPDRARPRSISRPSQQCLRQGMQALVLLPEIALTEPFLKRFEARFGCAPVAWHSGLRSSQRRREWRGIASGEAQVTVGARSALFLPYPEPRPDRRRRSARAELQAGGRRPVPRPRHGGDARQVRGHSGNSFLGDAADREPPHGRARPLPRSQPAPPLRRRQPPHDSGHRPDERPAAARPLARAGAGAGAGGQSRAWRADRSSSSTAAASRH